jgi:hypothetical protein
MKVFWNGTYVLPDKDLLKWSLQPSGQRSFETMSTSFRMKAKPYVFGRWHLAIFSFSLEMKHTPFRMKTKPCIFGHLALLVVSSFSFETKPTSFQMNVFWNEASILLDEGLLKWRLRPFWWRPLCFWVVGTLGRFFIFIWNKAYVLLDEGLLKWSLHLFRQKSFETKSISFRMKAKPYVFGRWRLAIFSWNKALYFWAFGTHGHFFVFIWNEAYIFVVECLLKWILHPFGRRSLEMKAMSFRMKAKPYVFGRLALLAVSSFWFETKPMSFQMKVFWNEAYVLLDKIFWNEAYILLDKGLLKWSLRPFRRMLSLMFFGIGV